MRNLYLIIFSLVCVSSITAQNILYLFEKYNLNKTCKNAGNEDGSFTKRDDCDHWKFLNESRLANDISSRGLLINTDDLVVCCPKRNIGMECKNTEIEDGIYQKQQDCEQLKFVTRNGLKNEILPRGGIIKSNTAIVCCPQRVITSPIITRTRIIDINQ